MDHDHTNDQNTDKDQTQDTSTDKKTTSDVVHKLCEALLLIKTAEEMNLFLKDLCTPQEIKDLAERWQVCKLLNQNELSYREINALTGTSLATIGRVARFLNIEPHQGYKLALKRMHKS